MNLGQFVIGSECYDFCESENNNKKHIAFACTDNYVGFAGILSTSVLINNTGKFVFHIFTDKCNCKDKKYIKSTAEKYKAIFFIHYVNNNIFNESNDPGIFSVAAYYRMIMPIFLRKYTDKFLYMDVDVCVLGDISDFWNIKMDNTISIVMEIQDERHKNEKDRVGVRKYFCSGIMFINIEEWNRCNISQKALKLSQKNIIYPYPDQDILNILLDDKTIFISNKYQYQYSMSWLLDNTLNPSSEKIPNDIVILHYTGASKPWHVWTKSLLAAKKWLDVKNVSAWRHIKLLEPKTYKEYHKVARLAKKEGSIKEIVYCYYKYAVAKIKYLLKK